MVITIAMKNLKQRGGKFHFRMSVPKDCQESVGRTEITQTLKTSDPAEAATTANSLTEEWKKKFESIRKKEHDSPVIKAKTNDTVADFRKRLADHMQQHLPDLLDQKTEEQLVEWCESITGDIAIIQKGEGGKIPLNDELGVEYPLPPQKSPGMTRRMNGAIVDALNEIRVAIDKEAGWKISEKVEADLLEDIPKVSNSSDPVPAKTSAQPTTAATRSLGDVSSQMLDAKNIKGKYRRVIEAEVACFNEWIGADPNNCFYR